VKRSDAVSGSKWHHTFIGFEKNCANQRYYEMKLSTKYKLVKRIAMVMAGVMLWELFLPLRSKALTSGPTQPEVQQFTPAGTDGLVDLFTGDFKYNIPLFELPGPNGSYPFNLGYQSGISMDQEASWVGLGWNLNPGAITRQMRGLPDEFAGDVVHVDQDIKGDHTFGITAGINGELLGADFLQGSLNLKLYYNSYRGFGYSISPGFSLNFAKDEGEADASSNSLYAGLGLSFDSQDGVGFNPQLGVTKTTALERNTFAIGAGYDSRQGLTGLNLSYFSSSRKHLGSSISPKDGNVTNHFTGWQQNGGSSSSLPLATAAHTPMVSMPMAGMNFNGTVKFGLGVGPAYASYSVGGFYDGNWLAKTSDDIPAYGYQNLEQADEKAMLDVNREKEGNLHKGTPNLAAPALTYDIYSVSGQGIGGSFRPYRSDVGVMYNRKVSSNRGGGGVGIDMGGTHGGNSFNLNYSRSTCGEWDTANFIRVNNPGMYEFHDGAGRSKDYETWYFRMTGESTSEGVGNLAYVNGDAPVRIGLDQEVNIPRTIYNATTQLEDAQGNGLGLTTYERYRSDSTRKSRNTVISPVTNGELKQSAPAMRDFKLKHYSSSASTFGPNPANLVNYARSSPDHHTAGMTVDQPDGMRYVYALPAYNATQVECNFTVNGEAQACGPLIAIEKDDSIPDYKVRDSDKYYNRTEIPDYAHSYLLTSVMGQDYRDIDTVPGPSDGDAGFWVKFNYVRVDADYKWRAPFLDANFDKGSLATVYDDKASYMYGTREVWYLASAETKTHVAEYYISQRLDGRGAKSELQNTTDIGGVTSNVQEGYSYRLDSIGMFSKLERYASNGTLNNSAKAIVKVHFAYNYSLCKNVNNNSQFTLGGSPASNSGKLTLEKLWFTYDQSARGELAPYTFDYHASDTLENPRYNPYAQDRWGTYKPYNDFCDNAEYPYTDQYSDRGSLDTLAAAWSLKGIGLPTGGLLEIDYEADDYGYVQNKRATRMFKVYSLEGGQVSNRVYVHSYKDNYTHGNLRRIYFELPHAMSSDAELEPYFHGMDTLYGKFKMDLKKETHYLEDYVKGYFKIAGYGLDSTCGGSCSVGYVELATPSENHGEWEKYHPLSLAAWHHLRANLNQLVNSPPFLNDPGNGTTLAVAKQRWKSLAALAPEIIKIFRGYYDHAHREHWAEFIDLDHSWIRLNEPDRVKVGGGSRVKRIRLYDNWDETANTTSYSNETGVVYDYHLVESGDTISSGVAQYEPMVGGDENPMRIAKSYPESTPLLSPYLLFFEYPINEQYMPAPIVGYRRVEVKSLAAEKVVNEVLAATVPTTGAAVHEFWTAKDFPVLTAQTEINMKPFHLPIPIPFVGSIVYDDLTASQGYSIVTNDMHGKPKKVSQYGHKISGEIDYEAISSVKYLYDFETRFSGTEREYHVLKNQFQALTFDVDPTDYSRSKMESRKFGEDHEFFVDMRESGSVFGSGGLALNVDIPIIPWLSVWPAFSLTQSRTRTAVTNKIIHRSGMMTGMEVWSDGSLVKTENLLYDAQTGRPLLTRVTNDFDDPIYSYEYPAFWAYPEMGAAYRNIGLQYSVDHIYGGAGIATATDLHLQWRSEDLYLPGDEVLIDYDAGQPAVYGIFVGFDGDDGLFWTEHNFGSAPGGDADFKVVRSGRRNLLGVSAEKIVTLKNPTINRDTLLCYRDITSPTLVTDTSWVVSDTTMDTLLSPCTDDFIWLTNAAIQATSGINSMSSYPYSQMDFSCINCTPTAVIKADSVTLQYKCEPPCNFQFTDATGNVLLLTDIDQVSDPMYVASVGFGSPPGYSFTQIGVDLLVNGQLVAGYIFSTCSLPSNILQIQPSVTNHYYSMPLVTPGDTILTDTLFMLDSVLSATATTFSDGWAMEYSDLRFGHGNAAYQLDRVLGLNPFATGERGVWRPKDNYVYVDDRNQSASLKIREDGTFDGLPMFDFQKLTFDACASNWRHVSEITRYSPFSYEIEEKDALNVHSAALYGYLGKLPTAVAVNSDYREIGFEGFEEYGDGASLDVLDLSTGNIDIYTDATGTAPFVYGVSAIGYASGNTANCNVVPNGTYDSRVKGRSDGELFDPACNVAEPQDNAVLSSNVATFGSDPYLHLHGGDYWKGYLFYQRPVLDVSPNDAGTTAYSDAKAHTGERSFKWVNKLEFPQNRLKLHPGTTYTLQAWVSRDSVDVPTFRNDLLAPGANIRLGIRVRFYDAAGSLISSSDLLEPSGYLVEGWQKIEGDFEVPANTANVSFWMSSGKVGGAFSPAYLDDIRIQPLKSKMTCYVYDPENYRLRASLDDDNFATVYHYDEAGGLYLVQKETVLGIRTLQESRGYLGE
jgi:hypothetical protein